MPELAPYVTDAETGSARRTLYEALVTTAQTLLLNALGGAQQAIRGDTSAVTGGLGVAFNSTLVALILTNLLTSDLTIDGLSTWILAALIVWLFTAIATFLLAYLFVKNRADERKA